MRLNRYLASCGLGSRRRVETFIINRQVTVNGRLGELSTQVNPSDQVVYAGRLVTPSSFVYLAVNKPVGVISSTSDAHADRLVTDLVPYFPHLFPVGRLDCQSSGLMILTNDGRLSQKLTHPKFHLPKTYLVELVGQLDPPKIRQFETGIVIDGQKTLPAVLKVVTSHPRFFVVEITLYQGLKRQIRLMAAALHLHVQTLSRIAIGPVKLGQLPVGGWRHLTPVEIKSLLSA